MIFSEIVLNNTFQVKSFHREVYSNSIIGATMSNSPRTIQCRTSPPKMFQSNLDSCGEARTGAMENLAITTACLMTGCLTPINAASVGVSCFAGLVIYLNTNYKHYGKVKRKCNGGGNPGLLPTLPDDRCEHLRDSVGPAHYMTADCRIVPHIP